MKIPRQLKNVQRKFEKARKATNTNVGFKIALMKEIYIPQIKKGTYAPKKMDNRGSEK